MQLRQLVHMPHWIDNVFVHFGKSVQNAKKVHKIEIGWAHCTEGLLSPLIEWLSQLSALPNSFQQVNQVVEKSAFRQQH